MKNPSQHVSFAGLADLAESGAQTQERTKSSEHISNCEHCAAEFERVKQVINVMRDDISEDAPRDVIARVVNLFGQRAESSEPLLLRSIVAALSFDSFAAAPAFGVRSGQATLRQLIYSAEENDLDLRIAAEGDSWTVSGQVLGANCAGGSIELQDQGRPSASAILNDLCEFTLSPVPSGTYRLRLLMANSEVEIPSLDLRA
jgi:hypothetical protein